MMMVNDGKGISDRQHKMITKEMKVINVINVINVIRKIEKSLGSGLDLRI